jgi:hypothetical protein
LTHTSKLKRILEEKRLLKEAFENTLSSIVLPTPPEGVYNVLFRFAEVTEEDRTNPPEEVKIIDSPAVRNENGKVTTKEVSHIEQRYPSIVVKKWVVKVNASQDVAKGKTTSATNTTSKRAVAVYKRNADKADEFIGNYKNCKEFTEQMKAQSNSPDNIKKWDSTGDSATRVAERNGYYTKPIESV